MSQVTYVLLGLFLGEVFNGRSFGSGLTEVGGASSLGTSSFSSSTVGGTCTT